MCYPTAVQTGNRMKQKLPEFYHVLVNLPCKKTPAENTETESGFQEVRKNVKIYLLKTSGCHSFSILQCVGVECGWGSSAMGLEFEFNIRALQSSQVVPSVRPHGQKGLFYLRQCFSTFVRPRPGKFFFHKTRALSQQIYS